MTTSDLHAEPSFDVPRTYLERVVRTALEEDAPWGDLTTNAVVPPLAQCRGIFECAADGILAGMPVVEEVFRQLDPTVRLQILVPEGAPIMPGDAIAMVAGPARSVLTGERVALNFLQRLSGVASLTARYVSAVSGTQARITDTRKTTPGLRLLQRYAVRAGGGANHRMCLSDAVLIKDNHIAVAGGICAAVQRARTSVPHTATITVECETLDHVSEALEAGADILLLDNMGCDMLRKAVDMVGDRAITEASGGITLANVTDVAATGVHRISVGALTHSAVALDMRLELRLAEPGGD
jgi:nicotinate-nucleotide pyrophosphorylase (carboxylating)